MPSDLSRRVALTRRFCLAFVVTVACYTLVGCSDPASKWTEPNDDDYYWKSFEHVVESFEHHENFSAEIAECSKVELYEGLPHPNLETALFKEELRNKQTVELADWPFYAKPIELSKNDAARLKAIYCMGSSFEPFGGWKSCGGYHPDWCIKWTKKNRIFLVQFCFGCAEMQTTDGKIKLYCDIPDTKELEEILKPYQKLRPLGIGTQKPISQ